MARQEGKLYTHHWIEPFFSPPPYALATQYISFDKINGQGERSTAAFSV